MPVDPKRRYYVVTTLVQSSETPEQCDDRICDLLHVEWGKTAITCTVLDDAVFGTFRKLRSYAVTKGKPDST